MNGAFHRAIELMVNYWNGRRVLVIGEVIPDKYIHGTVERISLEAPVLVVCDFRTIHCPGGAANVVMNIASLGAKARIIGFVGEDEDAGALNADLAAAGVSTALVPLPDFPTTSKLRILSSNQQMLHVDFEKAGTHPEAAYEKLIGQAREVIPSC